MREKNLSQLAWLASLVRDTVVHGETPSRIRGETPGRMHEVPATPSLGGAAHAS